MDNGLIFPYPRNNDRVEASDAKHARCAGSLRGDACGPSTRPYAGAVSVLTGVTQERSRTGQWLIRGKDVGWEIGKSVSREA